MDQKIVLIGAGSLWGPFCIMDFCASSFFEGDELVMVDIHEERLHWAVEYAKRIAEQAGLNQKIIGTTDAKKALEGATHVIVAVAVGGDEAWKQDVRIPHQYGVYQSVGDTIGPGGFFRGWRHMVFFENLLKNMEKICPQAFLINLANPMNVLCRFIEQTSPIRSIGLCHGIRDSKDILNQDEPEKHDFEIIAAGNNHFLFALDIQSNGKDAMHIVHNKSEEFWKRHGVLSDLWKRYGIFTINYDRHPAEFVPYYLTEETDYGETLGVSKEPGEFKNRDTKDPLDDLKEMAQSTDPIEIKRTTEPVADLIELDAGYRSGLLHVNIPNKGSIPNVPDYGNVEIPAYFDGGKMMPLRDLNLPMGLSTWVSRTCDVQEMTVDAFISKSRKKAITALGADALVNSYEKAEKIFDELYSLQKQYLPELKE